MNEVLEYIEILDENFVPDVLSNLYINIPVAILDYKELIADNQPESSVLIRYSEADILTMFNYDKLAKKLKHMLKEENNFYL